MAEAAAAAATTRTVSSKAAATTTTTTLRAVGFCGADDSVHPNMLVLIAQAYPIVEFGILFRPDKEGQPRYATMSWVESLAAAVQKANQYNHQQNKMKLAAHFCGSRVTDVLQGNGDDFIQQVIDWGFGRIQINATAVNGVDTSQLAEQVPNIIAVARRFAAQVEFIIQQNEETRPLWQGLLEESCRSLPRNISMLVDESKGTGQAAKSWPTPPSSSARYDIGYAGGIGPHNIQTVLPDVVQAAGSGGRASFWIDMESSLRSIKDGKDVFDLDKCYTVIDAVCQQGLSVHPPFLNNPGGGKNN
jgi:phosphoribosylanthranilate isomerase